MNTKRWLLASLAVLVAHDVMEMIIHGGIMSGSYMEIASVWRPEAEMMSKMWIIYILTPLFFSPAFVYIFIKGYEGRGIGEGIRFGLVVGLMISVPMAYNQYTVYPIPYIMAFQWFVYTLIEFIILGIVAAAIYKPAEEAAAPEAAPAAPPTPPEQPPAQ